MKGFLLLSLMVVGIAALVMGGAPGANASLVMTLDDLGTMGTDLVIFDESPSDFYSGAGVVGYSGLLGDFVVNVAVGTSKPHIGGPNQARLDLLGMHVSGAAGSLEVMLTDTDFVVLGQPHPATLMSEIGGTTDGTVYFTQILDLTNNEFAAGSSSFVEVNQGPFSGGPFSGTASMGVDLGPGAFSLTEKVTVTHSGAGQITSFDALSSVAVPEPATMLLLGAGLVGFCAVGRKKLLKRP